MNPKAVRAIVIVLVGLLLGSYFKNISDDKKVQIEWQPVAFKELSFQSPFKVETDPEPVKNPPEVEVLIKEYQQWRAVKSGELQFAIARIVYQDKVSVSLEGAAAGSINSMAQGYGDKTPVPSFDPIQNKPYSGLTAIYNTTVDNKKMLIRGAYIVRGQNLYMFIAIFPDGSFAENDIYKIFESIELKD